MPQLIIPIFIGNRGCPNRCVFCNEKKTAGDFPDKITESIFRETLFGYINKTRQKPDRIQIAFYGGNFTGIDKSYQADLLGFAKPFVEEGLIASVRISTRPDYIDSETLDLLEKFHVGTVEIGAQSMVDEVLDLAGRGHSSSDVRNAVRILKDRGFETGVHLMAGLPGDGREKFKYTVDEIIALRPDMVRIHPTIVFKDTAMAESYRHYNYIPMTMSDAIDYCKYALIRFEEAGIPVIRLGLQTTREMEEEGSIIAGPFHPAFRSLVEGGIFLDMASSLMELTQTKSKEVTFTLSPKDVSSFRNLKNQNISILKRRFNPGKISVKTDSLQKRRTLVMTVCGKTYKTDILSLAKGSKIGNYSSGCRVHSATKHQGILQDVQSPSLSNLEPIPN